MGFLLHSSFTLVPPTLHLSQVGSLRQYTASPMGTSGKWPGPLARQNRNHL